MDVGTLEGYHRALQYLRSTREGRIQPAA
jgi:hypothetical protein